MLEGEPQLVNRWVITGGGTGGHIYPAMAVIQHIQEQGFPVQIQYVGKTGGMEAEKILPLGVPFYGIVFSGMPRFVTWRWLPWLIQFWVATVQLIWQFGVCWKPTAVFSTGGYVTAPVLLAALLTQTPYVVHEPDAHAGLVNRVFSRWAAHVTTAFNQTFPEVPLERVTVTGNPIRATIRPSIPDEQHRALNRFFPDAPIHPDKPIRLLLVTGGSQGAARINEALVKALPELMTQFPDLYVIHQTGARDHEAVQTQLQHLDLPKAVLSRYWVRPFIENMPDALSAASLAVCRSGSLTLSEHCAAGVPMILVPYPYAAADHQTQNAQRLVAVGAACMIADSDLTHLVLCQQAAALLTNLDALNALAQAALSQGRYQAAEQIVDQLLKLRRAT